LSSGSETASTATVSLRHRIGRVVKEAAVGSGPVEAIFRAIGRASETSLELTDFQVKGLTSGLNGVGEVTVEVEELGQRHRGRATGSDIMHASAQAFLRVVNRVVAMRETHRELVDVFGQ
jgi:2-isopropylmalate synthase